MSEDIELKNEDVIIDDDLLYDVDDDDVVDEFEMKHLTEAERQMIKKYCKR